MRKKAHEQSPRHLTHVIWMGDFNRHHPMWDKSRNAHLFTQANLDKARIIIDVMANYDLQMILPKNVLTLCSMATKNFTQPDNILVSSSLREHMIECKMIPEEQPARTDHMPIITTLDTSPGRQEEMPKHNFKATDWLKF